MAEEGERVEAKWQRREADERQHGRGGRESRGYVTEEGERVESTWQKSGRE